MLDEVGFLHARQHLEQASERDCRSQHDSQHQEERQRLEPVVKPITNPRPATYGKDQREAEGQSDVPVLRV